MTPTSWAAPAGSAVPGVAPHGVQAVYATFRRRASALVLDLVIDLLAAAVIFGWTEGSASGWLFAAFLVLHHVGLSMEGGTMGKRMLGLRLVRTDGARVPLGRAIVRELVRLVASLGSLGLGFLWMLDQPERRTWHDLAAGTIVDRELAGDVGPVWRYDPPWRSAHDRARPLSPAPVDWSPPTGAS
jgi:uncharacterized RDD family membrane protein YckC